MKKLTMIAVFICFCFTLMTNQAPAEPAKGKAMQVNKTDLGQYLSNIEMVSIPADCFQMVTNSDSGQSNNPTQKVCLNDYLIGKYEVTQGLWQAVMGNNPSHFKLGPDHPVEMVSWDDTQTFLSRLNSMTGKSYRLPTAAEWEFACFSGRNDEKFCGGNDPDKVAWYDEKGGKTTKKVGTKKPNRFGVYDMSGNVEEWMQDWSGPVESSPNPIHNPTGPKAQSPEGFGHVVRGGEWNCGERILRAARRNNGGNSRANDRGFRLVLPK